MDEETKKECADYNRNLFLEAAELDADLVVFDEIMAAVNYGMVPEKDILDFLENRPKKGEPDGLEIVLTGGTRRSRCAGRRTMWPEICKRKHPFDKGIMARRGEY